MEHLFQIRRLPKHGVWSCEMFQRMDISNKWNAVKKEKFSFCCFDDHYSKDCKRKKKCGVQDCDRGHHKLLHFQKKDDFKQKEVEMVF